jgi:hypothetical protein
MDSLSDDHRSLDPRSISVRKLNIVREAAGRYVTLEQRQSVRFSSHPQSWFADEYSKASKWRIRVRILWGHGFHKRALPRSSRNWTGSGSTVATDRNKDDLEERERESNTSGHLFGPDFNNVNEWSGRVGRAVIRRRAKSTGGRWQVH